MTPALATSETPPSSGDLSSRWFGASVTDRLLKAFTVIEPGEGIGALMLAGNVFLLLTAYYMLKTVREALILAEVLANIRKHRLSGARRPAEARRIIL